MVDVSHVFHVISTLVRTCHVLTYLHWNCPSICAYASDSRHHRQNRRIHLLSIFEGMSELVKVRPENPVEWLASYLVRNDPQKAGAPGPAK